MGMCGAVQHALLTQCLPVKLKTQKEEKLNQETRGPKLLEQQQDFPLLLIPDISVLISLCSMSQLTCWQVDDNTSDSSLLLIVRLTFIDAGLRESALAKRLHEKPVVQGCATFPYLFSVFGTQMSLYCVTNDWGLIEGC